MLSLRYSTKNGNNPTSFGARTIGAFPSVCPGLMTFTASILASSSYSKSLPLVPALYDGQWTGSTSVS